MKKISLLLTLAAATSILIKCKQDTRTPGIKPQMLDNRSSRIDLKSGKNDSISSYSKSLGISSITAKQTSDDVVNLNITGREVNVNGYAVSLDNDQIMVKTLKTDQQYIIYDKAKSSYFKFDFKENTSTFLIKKKKFAAIDINKQDLRPGEKIEVIKLLSLTHELFNRTLTRKTVVDWMAIEGRPVSGSDLKLLEAAPCYRYNYSFGFTIAAAEDQAEQDKSDFLLTHRDCKQIGNPETSCLFTFSPCTTVVTFKCVGETCDKAVIIE